MLPYSFLSCARYLIHGSLRVFYDTKLATWDEQPSGAVWTAELGVEANLPWRSQLARYQQHLELCSELDMRSQAVEVRRAVRMDTLLKT